MLILITSVSCEEKETDVINSTDFSDLEIADVSFNLTDGSSTASINSSTDTVQLESISVTLNSISGNYPDEFNEGNMSSGTIFLDNGYGHDAVAGDHIYTSTHYTFLGNVFQIPANGTINAYNPNNGDYLENWYIRGKGDIAYPGDDCLGETCPETSLFGGQTWICVCFTDVEWCFGDCPS